MRLVNCIICGVEFPSASWNDKSCSQVCREERERQRDFESYWAKRPMPQIAKCVICDGNFQARNRKTCSNICRDELRRECNQKHANKSYWRKRRAQPPRISKCVVCGAEFRPKNGRVDKVCSQPCRLDRAKKLSLIWREKNREKTRKYYQAHCEKFRERGRIRRERKLQQIREYQRSYYLANHERISERNRRWRERNRERTRESKRRYYLVNREQIQEKHRRWAEGNKNRRKEAARRYAQTHPEQRKKAQQKYYAANRDRRHDYREKNRDQFREQQRLRYLSDLDFRDRRIRYSKLHHEQSMAALEVFRKLVGPLSIQHKNTAKRILQQLTGEQSHDNATS